MTFRGLGLRIREGGSRNYVVGTAWEDLTCRYTIGKSASVLSLDEARKRRPAGHWWQLTRGKDPTADKANKRAARHCFSSVANDYLEAISHMKPRSRVECTRHLTRRGSRYGLAVGAVSRSTVAARLRRLRRTVGTR